MIHFKLTKLCQHMISNNIRTLYLIFPTRNVEQSRWVYFQSEQRVTQHECYLREILYISLYLYPTLFLDKCIGYFIFLVHGIQNLPNQYLIKVNLITINQGACLVSQNHLITIVIEHPNRKILFIHEIVSTFNKTIVIYPQLQILHFGELYLMWRNFICALNCKQKIRGILQANHYRSLISSYPSLLSCLQCQIQVVQIQNICSEWCDSFGLVETQYDWVGSGEVWRICVSQWHLMQTSITNHGQHQTQPNPSFHLFVIVFLFLQKYYAFIFVTKYKPFNY